MVTSCTELLEALGAGASPLPWFLDGFDLHDAGTWVIAVMAREGNPSTKSSPEATKAYALVAVNHFAACVKALEGNIAAEAHVVFCEDCDSGALNFCLAGSELVNAAGRAESQALLAVRRALEAALEVK